MAFRVKDLLIAVAPVRLDGRLVDFPQAADDCTRCTGLTNACPGCTRIQCSEHPTRNFGRDTTIYEAVRDFRAAELLLLQSELKMAEQRQAAGGKKAAEEADLDLLERQLREALEEVQRARKQQA
jgi:hypothetical protein